jgi:hypothetical protein
VKEGDKVRLLANEEEGWKEEMGTILGIDSGCVVVQLDEFDDDDGIREVTEEQVEVLT